MPRPSPYPWTLLSNQAPSRRGFYEVRVADIDAKPFVAEWCARAGSPDKRWWAYSSSDPTVEKTPAPLEGVISWRRAPKAAVERLLEREPTEAECIERAYASYCSWHLNEPELRVAIPPSRRLSVGDPVEYGAHTGVTVAALYEDGAVVVVRYVRRTRQGGKDLDQGWSYSACHWLNVIPLATGRDTALASAAAYPAYQNSDLSSLLHRVVGWASNDDTPYQRGYVWTREDQDRYLDSLFQARDLGRFLFVRNAYPLHEEVLDGKQRLHTLLLLVSSQLPYQGVYWHEMSARDRDMLLSRSVQFAVLSAEHYSRAQLLRIFLDVNVAGVPQTEAHLAHVRELLAREEANEVPALAA